MSMQRTCLSVAAFAILLSALLIPPPVQAAPAAQTPPGSEPYSGAPLCLPDTYLTDPGDCLPLGPAAFLTDLARQGIAYPSLPLPAAHPGSDLSQVNINYAKINLEPYEPAPLFSSLQDAVAGTNPVRYLAGGDGLRYVSYTQRADQNGGHYVLLPSGEWMRASPAAILSTFQGLVFRRNPTTSFGWIFDNTTPKSSPSALAPENGQPLVKEQVVPIYKMVEAENTQWYMVGLGQWVERRYIRQFQLKTTPPEGVENGRWIEVNLYEQTMAVYEDSRLVFATLIATGSDPYFTRPGLFKVYKKKATENMSGAFASDKSDFYYLADVPWTMYFDEARAIHGAYWRAWFGIPQSHGCVNLSIGDARWVYDWAQEGDYVYVWDPSGQTPTDPKFYTQGGA